MVSITAKIKEFAATIGIDKIGIVPAKAFADEAANLREWLDRGYHGEMAWMERDPIPMYHRRLLRLGVGEEALTAISQQVTLAVQTATDEATDGALPSLDKIFSDVWADGGWTWRN